MRSFIHILRFVTVSWFACLNGLHSQDTVIINCLHEEVLTFWCPTCSDAIGYEIFTGITLELPDTTYRLYKPYRIWDEDTLTVLADINNTQVSFSLTHSIYADKNDLANSIADCLADTSGSSGTTVVTSFSDNILTITVNGVTDTAYINASGGGSCPCCTDINFFDSDTAAYYQGRINKDEYYLTSASHLEGLGKGIYKQVPENYGWELWTTDSLSYGFGGLIVKSKNTTRVGFDAAFLSPCRVEAPAVDLHYFDSNESAILGGLSVGDSYLLSQDNLRGLPKGFIQKITTP